MKMLNASIISLSDTKLNGLRNATTEAMISRLLSKLGFNIIGLHIYPSDLDYFPLKDELDISNLLIVLNGVGKLEMLKDLGNSIGLDLVKIDEAFEHIQTRLFESTQDLQKVYSVNELKKYEKYAFCLESSYVLQNEKGLLPGFFIVILPEEDESIRSILDEGLEYYLRNIAGVSFSTTVNLKFRGNSDIFRSFIDEMNSLPVYLEYSSTRDGFDVVLKIFSKDPEGIDKILKKIKDIVEKYSDKADIDASFLKDM